MWNLNYRLYTYNSHPIPANIYHLRIDLIYFFYLVDPEMFGGPRIPIDPNYIEIRIDGDRFSRLAVGMHAWDVLKYK